MREAFAGWVGDHLRDHDAEALLAYREQAPEAVRAHPTEEHFLPLFVAWGAAGTDADVVPRRRRLRGGCAGDGLVSVSPARALNRNTQLPTARPPPSDACAHGSLTLSANRWSARVRPRLIAAIGFPWLCGALAETVARPDHQRRADDEHGVGLVQRRASRRRRDPAARSRRKTRRPASTSRRSARSAAR